MHLSQNIKLTLNFRKISSTFLNCNIDMQQNNILVNTINVVKKVIIGYPIVQYYIQMYRVYDIWQEGHNKGPYKVFYKTYSDTQLFRH